MADQPAPSRRSVPSAPVFPASTCPDSRAARTSAALSRSFVTPRVLSNDVSSTINDFVGPMASERYASLPPKSNAAAKALLAVALTKGISEVRLLENIRRKRQLSDLPSPWFDFMADSMLKVPTPCFKPFLDRCANNSMPSVLASRLAPSPPDARERTRAIMERVFGVENNETRASHHLNHLSSSQQNISKPNDSSVIDVDLIDGSDTPIQTHDKLQHLSQPPDVNSSQAMLVLSPPTQVLDPSSAEPLQQLSITPPPTPKDKLTVSLVFDDQTGDVSLDIDLIPDQPPAPPPPQPFARIVTSSSHHQSNAARTKLARSQPIEASHVSAQPNFSPNLSLTGQTAPPPNPVDLSTMAAEPSSSLPLPESHAMPKSHPSSSALSAPIRPPPDPPQNIDDTQLVMVTAENMVPTASPPSPPVRIRRKRPNLPLPRRTSPGNAKRRQQVRERLTAALGPEPSQSRPASQEQRRRSSRLSMSDIPSKRPTRRARPIAPLLDASDSDDEQDDNDDLDQDFDIVVATEAPDSREEERSIAPVEKPVPRPRETRASASASQRTKHVRFSDEVEEMNVAASTEDTIRTRGRMKRKRESMEPVPTKEEPLPSDDEEEVLDSNDAFISRQKVFTRAGNRRRPSRSHETARRISRRPVPTGSDFIRPSSSREHKSSTRGFSRLATEPRPGLWKQGLEDLERGIREAEEDEYSLSGSESDHDIKWSDRLLVLRHLKMRMAKSRMRFEDLRHFTEEEEAARCRLELENTKNYGKGRTSPAAKFLEEMYRESVRGRSNSFTHHENDEEEGEDEDEDEEQEISDSEEDIEPVFRPSRGHRDSSGSSDSQKSSDDDIEDDDRGTMDGEMDDFSRRSLHEARSKACQARELQRRVCGELLPTMTAEASRRVLRWAGQDFKWFEPGKDCMDIVAARSSKPCGRCTFSSDKNEMCEESILLKLFKDMTWRKVRRMRHSRDRRRSQRSEV